MINDNVWLIGTGPMAKDYSKVLNALSCQFNTIGRGDNNADVFEKETNNKVIRGGLDAFLATAPQVPNAAIVSVGIESLQEVTKKLLNYGVQYILLEKPGVGYADEIYDLTSLAAKKNAKVLLAYNRRFYSSVLKAKELIEEDGGVSSFTFEFTEWSHVIRDLKKDKAEHSNWFLGNSSHVIDTAFFLAGKPKSLTSFFKGGIAWHPSSSIFVGAGESEKGALFSYHANWEAPGRWWIEILTKRRRFIFRPVETLQCQMLGSVAINPVELDDQLDRQFKPGLFLQTQAFLKKKTVEFCDVHEQQIMIDKYYKKMSGY